MEQKFNNGNQQDKYKQKTIHYDSLEHKNQIKMNKKKQEKQKKN